jgi:hypothetical protein
VWLCVGLGWGVGLGGMEYKGLLGWIAVSEVKGFTVHGADGEDPVAQEWSEAQP